jgi:hypothetical protein
MIRGGSNLFGDEPAAMDSDMPPATTHKPRPGLAVRVEEEDYDDIIRSM